MKEQKKSCKRDLFSFLKASLFKQYFLFIIFFLLLKKNERENIKFLIGCHLKSPCCDPKDSELYLSRIKSGETLMEVRNNTDVQIVCQI